MLNPFRGLPNARQVWAWGMYDLANQSFTLLINTVLFGVYVQEVIAPNKDAGDRLWATMTSVSMLLVVLVSPIVGAMADQLAWKKRLLIVSGVLCVALTCSLGLLQPGWVVAAVVLYIPANFFYNIGENTLASFLPEIADDKNMGRVSGTGWTMGYVGALLLLVITSVAIMALGWKDPTQWRPLIVFAGLWFAVVAIPTVVYLRERAEPEPDPAGRTLVAIGVSRVIDTFRHARHYKQLMRFLAIFFIYGMGVQTVIFFAGIITRDGFGFGTTKLFMFLLQLTVTAGIAAFCVARYQDRLGHKRTVLIFLFVWSASTVSLAMMTLWPSPEWLFWVLANGVGFGLGGIGTSSRALVACFTPAHRTAEFFGLWGMVYKFSGVVGLFVFGFVKAGIGLSPALFLLAGVFVVGLVLILTVDEREGIEAARTAEREHAGR